MIGLVIVSHSASLAEGVVELAREMGGAAVAVEAAGGMADPPGAIGTDAELVRQAIARAASPDGVLVLMDLGSAVMSAEMAVEMGAMEPDGPPVLLCEAPLVEGAVAAAARAGAGAGLQEAAAEARAALAMKASQLGIAEPVPAGAPAATEPGAPADAELRVQVVNELGLHARPAARVVQTAARFDARVEIVDATSGRGPADGRSLTALVTLGVQRGHTLLLRASGPQAAAALEALRALAAKGFGDDVGAGAAAGAGAATAGPDGSPVAVGATSAGPDGSPVAVGATSAGPDGSPVAVGAATAGPGGSPAAVGAATAGPGGSPAAVGAATTGPGGSPVDSSAPIRPAAGAILQGVPASPGIVICPARLAAAAPLAAADAPASGDAAAEWARLEHARAGARRDIEAARGQIAERAGANEAAIFDAHLLLLDDAAILEPARRAIDDGRSAAAAWSDCARAAAALYRGLDDPYLRERAADVEDVAGRVLRHLAGETAPAGITEPGILVVRDLTPGDAAALDRALVRGLAVARGGATSHAAILARALGIPAVVGLGEGVLGLAEGTELVLDGATGALDVAPAPDVIRAREAAREAAEVRRAQARRRACEPARTTDGETLEVAANLGSADEAAAAVELGADGVGLLRTEFLFLDRDEAPSEEEQRAVYGAIAAALDGRPLIVRTLDAGADKPLRFLHQAHEDNPFLGVRGIRLGLAQPGLLRTQLRAILSVAGERPVRVMFPMVSALAEYAAARALVEEERATLGVPPIDVGIMVEVPAVAVTADRFAPAVDFFSVGTNDLGQYTLAAERGNEALAPLLSGPQPAVLRLIATLTAVARRHGRWVGVCGELAGDPAAAVLLAGLGVTELSMAPSRIPEVKDALRSIALADAREIAGRALDCDDAAAVLALVVPALGEGGGR